MRKRIILLRNSRTYLQTKKDELIALFKKKPNLENKVNWNDKNLKYIDFKDVLKTKINNKSDYLLFLYDVSLFEEIIDSYEVFPVLFEENLKCLEAVLVAYYQCSQFKSAREILGKLHNLRVNYLEQVKDGKIEDEYGREVIIDLSEASENKIKNLTNDEILKVFSDHFWESGEAEKVLKEVDMNRVVNYWKSGLLNPDLHNLIGDKEITNEFEYLLFLYEVKWYPETIKFHTRFPTLFEENLECLEAVMVAYFQCHHYRTARELLTKLDNLSGDYIEYLKEDKRENEDVFDVVIYLREADENKIKNLTDEEIFDLVFSFFAESEATKRLLEETFNN